MICPVSEGKQAIVAYEIPRPSPQNDVLVAQPPRPAPLTAAATVAMPPPTIQIPGPSAVPPVAPTVPRCIREGMHRSR